MEVLGISVSDDLLDQWSRWFAPAVQPFFVDSASDWPGGVAGPAELARELRDTFKVWRMPERGDIVWLDEGLFLGLPRARRAALVREQVDRKRGAVPTVRGWRSLLGVEPLRSQADGHRFVWWPSLLEHARNVILPVSVEAGEHASRHSEVARSTWRGCEQVLPGPTPWQGRSPAAAARTVSAR